MSHKGAIAATALLGIVWAVLTFGARPLTPLVQGAVERVEIAVGLDVSRGTRTLDGNDR